MNKKREIENNDYANTLPVQGAILINSWSLIYAISLILVCGLFGFGR
jgi:hypothetical protein